MSEVDVTGQVLVSFTDVKHPCHLSSDSAGHVLVADLGHNRIVLLSSHLQLQRVVVDVEDSELEVCEPRRLCHNERTSQLYVLHDSCDDSSQSSDTVSVLSAHTLTN